MLAKRIERVHQNRLTKSKRSRVVTERFEKLTDLSKTFDALSPYEKRDRIFQFLHSYSHLDTYSISEPGCTGSE